MIETTDEHPFFVKGRGWTPANEIRPGDEVRTEDGWVPITSSEATGRFEPVYNFRVADTHTYFVGTPEWGFAVWAHNLYSGNSDAQLRDRLASAGVDDVLANVILNLGAAENVPAAAGNRWAHGYWTQERIQSLLQLPPHEQLALVQQTAQRAGVLSPNALTVTPSVQAALW